MKKIYSIILLLIPIFLFSQNKIIVPQKGTVVFSSKTIITNHSLYMSSIEDLMKDVEKAVNLEQITDGKQNDSILLETALTIIEDNFGNYFDALDETNDNLQFHHQFKGIKILSYKTLNNTVLGDSVTINSKTGLTNRNPNNLYYSDNEIVNVKEFRNKTKKINGFECFKVVYSFIEDSGSDLSIFMPSYLNHREIWVTEKLKCSFHPVINDRIILEKYYPLEILQYSEAIKGCEIKYSLVSFQIN